MKKILTLFTALILFGSMTVKADYYVAGTMNGWNAGDNNYKMSGSNPYSVTKQLNSGDYQFKITQGNWDWSTASFDNSASNVTLSNVGGNIKFTLSTTSDVTFYYSTSSNKAYVQATPVVVPSYTFTNGTTIYYDFTAYGSGVNVCINGGEPWHENTSAIFCETLSSAWEVTATTNLFKSAPNGWSYKTCSTLPTEGQNMLVGDANGVDCHWDTYSGGMPEPTPATIQLHSNITNPSWESSANFALAGNEETASLTLTGVTKGNYEFGVKIDGTWTSNGSAFTRANNSHAVVAGSGNCTFNADRNGDYTFTWTYATNTLAVTYPAVPAQSVTFNSLASEILKGSVINLANCVTSSGIDDPTYRFYIKEKNGSYGDAINANYTFNANGEYVVKVEALEYGEPVAYDESAVVVYQSYTFTNGTTIYVDFSAMTEGTKGVNYPKANEVGVDYDGAGAGTIKTIAFTANVTWTTMAEAFIKTEKNGWANLPFTVPGIGENCAVVAADGASYTWGTHAAPVVTVEAMGDWDGWTDALEFVPDGSGLTATATKHFDAGNYDFKLIVDGNWLSNANAFHRFWTSASGITSNNDENMQLQADADGDYVFTWTYATNAIAITFPETPKTGTNEVKFFPPRTEEHPWNEVYVYAWRRTGGENEQLTGDWPGIPATKDGEWYKATIAKGACVVFNDNNNGMQSFDIENVQKDVCYVANEIVDGDPIKAKFYESCTVNYFLTSGDEAIMGAGNAWKADLAERQLDGSNEITLTALPAGIYEFKLTNGSWAWSLGGQEHLNSACSSAAVTSGNGNVKFKIESAQDVTISYNPATQKICLSAETVLPFEEVRTGMTADNYYTVCFNREMKQIRGASLWSFIGRDADYAYIEQESAPFEAGKPFIVFAESEKLEAILDREVSEPVANGALHGTFTNLGQADLDGKKAAAGDKEVYLVIGNELRRATGASTGGNSLPAYRAYVIVGEIDPISTPSPAPGKKVRSMPMQKDQTQGFENIETSDKPVKVVIDGALYILRGENVYDATGRMVK